MTVRVSVETGFSYMLEHRTGDLVIQSQHKTSDAMLSFFECCSSLMQLQKDLST